jgi:hypothetical protein
MERDEAFEQAQQIKEECERRLKEELSLAQ